MNRPALLALTLVLLVVAGIGTWLLQHDPAPVPRPPVGDTPPPSAAPATATAGETREASAPPTTERALAEAVEPTPVAAADDPVRRLHGTITVVDENGREHPRCNGRIELEPMVPFGVAYSLHPEQTDVRDGGFEATVRADATRLAIGELHLEGRYAFCEGEIDLAALGVDEPIVLRAQWLEALRLRVLGEDTRADLSGIRVVRIGGWERARWRHPGNVDLNEVVAEGRSPLRLQSNERRDSVRYWVVAPGYAWSPIELATTEPGERVLQLARGGDVDLAIVGELADRSAVLRVRAVEPVFPGEPASAEPPSGASFTELRPRANDTVRIDALPEGAWSLSIELGDWYGDRLVLGHTTATVTAGTIVAAAITLRADAERPPAVTIGGTLSLSPRWGTAITLQIEPSGTLEAWTDQRVNLPLAEMQPAGGDTFRWGPVTLLAGQWQVLVDGTEHRTRFEIGPGLPTEVRIEVPEPHEIRVRVVDDETGETIADAKPSWYMIGEDWSGGWSHHAMTKAEDGWYEGLASVGKITLNTHPEGHVWLHREYDVRPGRNEWVLRVPRVCGVEIVLHDGDVTVPWPEDGHADITHTETKARAAYWSGNKIAASEPGEHDLTITDIDGFEPIPARKVVVEPARWTRVDIALRRKQ